MELITNNYHPLQTLSWLYIMILSLFLQEDGGGKGKKDKKGKKKDKKEKKGKKDKKGKKGKKGGDDDVSIYKN